MLFGRRKKLKMLSTFGLITFIIKRNWVSTLKHNQFFSGLLIHYFSFILPISLATNSLTPLSRCFENMNGRAFKLLTGVVEVNRKIFDVGTRR